MPAGVARHFNHAKRFDDKFRQCDNISFAQRVGHTGNVFGCRAVHWNRPARRQLVDAAPRPYSLPGTGEPSERPTISYQKPLLSQTQVQEVRSFIDWLRTRDSDIQ